MLAYVRARVRTRSDIILLERVSRRALTLFNMERLKIVLCIQNLFGRGERLAPPPSLDNGTALSSSYYGWWVMVI